MESELSKDKWKKKLTKEQYRVLRKKGTEPAFTGKFWNRHEKGVYKCAGCGAPLFSSEEKFDSGTGWPSFDRSMDDANVKEKLDTSHGMIRTEAFVVNVEGI
ncbi:Peptide methionine sulfoxide reductase MsrB [subsurface metagenome]